MWWMQLLSGNGQRAICHQSCSTQVRIYRSALAPSGMRCTLQGKNIQFHLSIQLQRNKIAEVNQYYTCISLLSLEYVMDATELQGTLESFEPQIPKGYFAQF
jgi:hypothetical protein